MRASLAHCRFDAAKLGYIHHGPRDQPFFQMIEFAIVPCHSLARPRPLSIGPAGTDDRLHGLC